jgi:hypothetical protein
MPIGALRTSLAGLCAALANGVQRLRANVEEMRDWRPANPSSPDDADEWRFRPLRDDDSEFAERLVDAFCREWVMIAGFASERVEEARNTVELLVADEWDPDGPEVEHTKRLRLTSWFTGSTYWLYEWAGDEATARRWIVHTADLQARNVMTERQLHGPTEWDGDPPLDPLSFS